MRPRLLIVFALIVLVPLALLAWIGVEGIRRESAAVQQNIERLLIGRLQAAASLVREILDGRERDMLRAAENLQLDTPSLRRWIRGVPYATQVFLLDASGKLVHPTPGGPLSASERRFLVRAEQVWKDQGRFFRQAESSPGRDAARSKGWYSWYHGNGIQLLFWQRLPSGQVLGIELDRVRFASDVAARLSGGGSLSRRSPALPAGWIRLIDSRGEILCQWGDHEPEQGEKPAAVLRLEVPLSSWRFEYFTSDPAAAGRISTPMALNLLAGLLAAGAALVGLAVYFYRENSRDLREAARRVTFVNQVSHELKTPLTNIRMYSELLRENLPQDDPQALRYAGVIVSESERLSRMIANVLAFARKQRDRLKIRRRTVAADSVIASVIEHFRPSLAARGVEIRLDAKAPEKVSIDPDALEQILNNLLSNVEKYAPGSGTVEIASRRRDDAVVVTVTDSGPGIPRASREEIFLPFRRLGDALTEGATGTGLGLSIARDLARLHGGDVRIIDSGAGACFEVTLKTTEAPA